MASKEELPLQTEKSLCPTLPPEVWVTIFSHHTDLVHLWTACRRISSSFRACVEHAFADNFLREMQIDFQLEKYNLGGKSKRPAVPVTFDRRGKHEGVEVAWFRDKRERREMCAGSGKNAQKEYDRIMRRWEENVRGWKAEMPNYTISIRGLVNDSALPGLSIDISCREICFDWRKALTFFYREQDLALRLKRAYHSRTAAQIRANNARLAKGENLMPADYPQPRHMAEAEIRRQVRRARLKESYQDDEQMRWAIDSLKHFEQYGAASGSAKAFKMYPDLPGAGIGERWFGSFNIVQELYLDEWSCMHRIDLRIEEVRNGDGT